MESKSINFDELDKKALEICKPITPSNFRQKYNNLIEFYSCNEGLMVIADKNSNLLLLWSLIFSSSAYFFCVFYWQPEFIVSPLESAASYFNEISIDHIFGSIVVFVVAVIIVIVCVILPILFVTIVLQACLELFGRGEFLTSCRAVSHSMSHDNLLCKVLSDNAVVSFNSYTASLHHLGLSKFCGSFRCGSGNHPEMARKLLGDVFNITYNDGCVLVLAFMETIHYSCVKSTERDDRYYNLNETEMYDYDVNKCTYLDKTVYSVVKDNAYKETYLYIWLDGIEGGMLPPKGFRKFEYPSLLSINKREYILHLCDELNVAAKLLREQWCESK